MRICRVQAVWSRRVGVTLKKITFVCLNRIKAMLRHPEQGILLREQGGFSAPASHREQTCTWRRPGLNPHMYTE